MAGIWLGVVDGFWLSPAGSFRVMYSGGFLGCGWQLASGLGFCRWYLAKALPMVGGLSYAGGSWLGLADSFRLGVLVAVTGPRRWFLAGLCRWLPAWLTECFPVWLFGGVRLGLLDKF